MFIHLKSQGLNKLVVIICMKLCLNEMSYLKPENPLQKRQIVLNKMRKQRRIEELKKRVDNYIVLT